MRVTHLGMLGLGKNWIFILKATLTRLSLMESSWKCSELSLGLDIPRSSTEWRQMKMRLRLIQVWSKRALGHGWGMIPLYLQQRRETSSYLSLCSLIRMGTLEKAKSKTKRMIAWIWSQVYLHSFDVMMDKGLCLLKFHQIRTMCRSTLKERNLKMIVTYGQNS